MYFTVNSNDNITKGLTMIEAKVWWKPPGSSDVYSIENSESGTSCFRFEPFSSSLKYPSIELRGHVVKSDMPESNTVEIRSEFTSDSTSKEEHISTVASAISEIQKGVLDKVVVSRVKSISLECTPEASFARKCESHPDAFVYLLDHPICGVWCGATPELLVSASDNRIETVSLAGTRTVDKISTSPWTSKEHEEQGLVTDYIETILESYGATDLRIEPRAELQYGNLIHLETRFRCSLKGSLSELAKELHPTPAVGGRPKAEACGFISDNERIDREYFAGYLGVKTASGSAYYVNLRCAKWMKGGVKIFAGGGIVSGSDVTEEWEETEAKLLAIQKTIV